MSAGQRLYSQIIPVEISDVIKQSCACNQFATHTAAIMLNDRLETVIANYSHLLEEDVAEKAYRVIEARNGQSA